MTPQQAPLTFTRHPRDLRRRMVLRMIIRPAVPSVTVAVLIVVLGLLGIGPTNQAKAEDWNAVARPSVGQPDVIGSYAKGCIGGAHRLPETGPGFQTIRMSRSRFWGHPDLIDVIQTLGRAVQREHIGIMLIGDLSQPRGGPMPWGHASHQIGLDADIWFRITQRPMSRAAREDVDPMALVDYKTWLPTAGWTASHSRMLYLAASDPRVERIFVNPGIKKQLCAMRWTDRDWLRKLRPWWGHNAHFHIRLACPADAAQCKAQAPPPPGDGCDSLDWWMAQRDTVSTSSSSGGKRREIVLPEACDAVFTAEARPERRESLLAAIIPPKKPDILRR